MHRAFAHVRLALVEAVRWCARCIYIAPSPHEHRGGGRSGARGRTRPPCCIGIVLTQVAVGRAHALEVVMPRLLQCT
jgi:hypothetical protein